MLRNWRFLIALMILPALACAPANNGSNTNENGDEETIALSAALTGGGEVPPVETNATGSVEFEYHPDEDELHFTVNVNNGIGVTAAHIHAGDATANGDVVAFLFEAEDTVNGVSVNGELASGELTATDLVNALEGMTVQDLIDMINTGGAYVNVHTSANPAGEIRGQIEQEE